MADLYLPVLTSALCRHGLVYFFPHVLLFYSSLEASRDLLETLGAVSEYPEEPNIILKLSQNKTY